MKNKMQKILNVLQKWFYPLNEFKDCNKGNRIERFLSFEYNKKKSGILIEPILNWLNLGSVSFLLLMWMDKVIANNQFVALCAAFCGIMVAISMVGLILMMVAFLFLTNWKVSLENNVVK